MADNIEKLRERVEKDPSSTLFVPLAEEYRKARKLDEAIAVLKAGIERQPGYTSARVALGKIYLEKDMLNEAREEFEHVVKAVPGNLYAQRKLADVLMRLGDGAGAIAQYKTVVSLNPLDEEANEILGRLKKEAAEQPLKAEVREQPAPAEAEEESVPAEDISGEGMVGLDAAPDWTSSIGPQGSGEVVVEDEEVSEEDTGRIELREDVGAYEAEDEEWVDEAGTSGTAQTVSSEAEAPSAPGVAEVALEEISLEEISEENIDAGLFGGQEEESPEEEGPDEVPSHQAEAASEAGDALAEADVCIQSGDFDCALKIYETLFSMDPENKQVLQRMNELKQLLKLLGREGNAEVERLQSFLDSIKDRKDEFFRNA